MQKLTHSLLVYALSFPMIIQLCPMLPFYEVVVLLVQWKAETLFQCSLSLFFSHIGNVEITMIDTAKKGGEVIAIFFFSFLASLKYRRNIVLGPFGNPSLVVFFCWYVSDTVSIFFVHSGSWKFLMMIVISMRSVRGKHRRKCILRKCSIHISSKWEVASCKYTESHRFK